MILHYPVRVLYIEDTEKIQRNQLDEMFNGLMELCTPLSCHKFDFPFVHYYSSHQLENMPHDYVYNI